MRRRPVRTSGRRAVQRFQASLERRQNSPVGRLAVDWFQRYFEASRNSASAATLYIFIAVMPVCLAVIGLIDAASNAENTFSKNLIEHLHLHDKSAAIVTDAFGTASQNVLAASLTAVVSFLIWGVGIGKLFQDVYSRAWRIELQTTAADQARFAIWFGAIAGLLTLEVAYWHRFDASDWLIGVPVWIGGMTVFWLWTPWYLLHHRIRLGALLPGALLTAVVLGGASLFSPLTLGAWMNLYASYFAAFGVVLALAMWMLVIVALALTCAVFAPVFADRRRRERNPS